jgi:hypothetical protein
VSSLISCFVLLDLFSAVPRPSGLISYFTLLNSFLAVPLAPIPLLCFALKDPFWAVRRVLGPIFIFRATGLIFGSTEGVSCSFHFERYQTHFQRYRGCRVLFSCFALPESFSALLRAPCPVFMFCAPELIVVSTMSIGCNFHVFRSKFIFDGAEGARFSFHFYATGLVFGGSEDTGYRFHVVRA